MFTCYEAGPIGYSLHRKLEKMGATNYVVRPRDWDEYGKNVKTDKRDAKELALHLDRYVNGNQDAFCAVRVPSPEQTRSEFVSKVGTDPFRDRPLSFLGPTPFFCFGLSWMSCACRRDESGGHQTAPSQ